MPPSTVSGMSATDDASNGEAAIGRDLIAYKMADAARLLSLSVRMVRYLVDRDELKSIKVGRARRVLGSSIEEYAAKQVTPGRLAS
jgi:excisionase family DNA binding protein